ncbi:MAG: mandelate racemase/muconate lactonizing enzyme family protein [Pseudomonadota bacterium]
MQIKSVDAIPLRVPFEDGSAGVGLMPTKWTHLDFALVRLETDDGLVGWGDAFAYSCLAPTTAAIRDMVRPLVEGQTIAPTPDGLTAFNLDLQRKLHLHGRYGITMFAISAVDIALWDLAAKAKGVPLSNFIGHCSRRQINAYASLVRYGDPGQVREFTATAVAEGYAYVKLHEITDAAITAGVEAAGSKARLMTDVNCNWSAENAEILTARCKELGLYWVEEPVFPPDNVDALADLETRHGMAMATGENACTSVEFARIVQAVTYPQPSVTKVGGVSEFLKVCDLADAAEKTVMPHAPYFGPGYWATLHIMAARACCGVFERFYITPKTFLDPGIPLPRRGQITVPDAPGLGFEPAPAVIDRYRVDK